MQTATESEELLLPKLRCGINNSYGTLFYMDRDDVILMSCSYPGYTDLRGIIVLDFWKEFCNLEDFYKCFPTNDPNTLLKVKTLNLIPLFKSGLIDISCYLEREGRGRRFFFTKDDEKLFIREEFKPGNFKVKANLVKGTDFVNYAIGFADRNL
jgi:hypothetical protein